MENDQLLTIQPLASPPPPVTTSPMEQVQPKPSQLPIVLLSLLSFIFLSGMNYFYLRMKSINVKLASSPNLATVPTNTTQPSPSILPKSTIEINPKTNQTIYTNDTYGFNFEYPQELFVYHGEQSNAFYISNKADGGAPMELGSDGLWLNVSFGSQGPAMESWYRQEVLAMPIMSTNNKSAITKLSNLNTNGVVGLVYFQGIPPSFVGEKTYSYVALWIKDSIIYSLNFSAFELDILKKYKPTFDQIVATFQFTD